MKKKLLTLTIGIGITGIAFSNVCAKELTLESKNTNSNISNARSESIDKKINGVEELSLILKYGNIKFIGNDEVNHTSQILVKESEKDKYGTLYNISNDTIILDAQTGNPKTIKDLKKNDYIYIYTKPISTMSLPAIMNPRVVLINVDINKSIGMLFEVGNVEKSNNGAKVLDKTKRTLLLINNNNYHHIINKSIIKAEELKEGDLILSFYNTITLSLPGIATPHQTYLIHSVNDNSNTTVNDNIEIDLSFELKTKGKYKMLPLRKVAEKLGFTVSWNEETDTATIDNGTLKAEFTLDTDNYYYLLGKSLQKHNETKFDIAPCIINGNTYVPIEAFEMILGKENITIDKNIIKIKHLNNQ